MMGAALVMLVQNVINSPKQKDFEEKHLGGYKFVNPLLECNISDSVRQTETKSFKNKLEKFIKENKSPSITYTSLYFRDLNNGPWIGINEKEEFSPASLLKVPLMMAVLKKVESKPAILKDKIPVNNIADNEVQSIKPSLRIKKGESLALDELIQRMIMYSDNAAQQAIFRYLGDAEAARTYSDLGLDVPTQEKTENFMSIKNYSSFFRILYNASYLTKEISDRALELLVNVEFRDGLVSGVPENIKVAHKFGERTITATNEKQFHDCGIVYYPEHPYLLCIMNRGDDIDKMVKLVENISTFVYSQIDSQFRDK